MQQRARVDEPSFHTHADTPRHEEQSRDREGNVCSCIHVCKREKNGTESRDKEDRRTVRTACICLCILIFLAHRLDDERNMNV